MSEALILESINPQYDERLFKKIASSEHVNMFCTKNVLNVKTKKQFLYTTCCGHVFFGEFDEQSLVILWVN